MRDTTSSIAVVLALATAPCAVGDVSASCPAPHHRHDRAKVKGQSSNGVFSFLGIQYSADTGGKNRFMPPRPPPFWLWVKNSDRFDPRCARASARLCAETSPKS